LSQTGEIITDLQRGKRKARKAVYEEYSPKLLGICLRYAKNKSEAEDILHDAFIKIYTKAKQYSGKGSFEGWMSQIVRNTAIQHIRDKIKKRDMEADIKYEEQDQTNAEPEFSLIPSQQLLQLIQQLPEGYRLVLNMFVFEEMSHMEIAEQLNISVSTSKSQFFRAKKQLQKRIMEWVELNNKDYE
jgi:RNA polymerase sigma-70 factor (ECF subfamily)